MQRAVAAPKPAQPIIVRSAVFDHGQLGLTVRRKGSFKDSAAQNFTAIAAALVDLAAGKDWAETAKAVRFGYLQRRPVGRAARRRSTCAPHWS